MEFELKDGASFNLVLTVHVLTNLRRGVERFARRCPFERLRRRLRQQGGLRRRVAEAGPQREDGRLRPRAAHQKFQGLQLGSKPAA